MRAMHQGVRTDSLGQGIAGHHSQDTDDFDLRSELLLGSHCREQNLRRASHKNTSTSQRTNPLLGSAPLSEWRARRSLLTPSEERSSESESSGNGTRNMTGSEGMQCGRMGSNESVRSVRTRGKGPGSAAKQAMSAAEKEARRTLALQEKNRRAQRRFRERQKSRVATLEAEVDELKQQLHASNQGRDELERQNQALQQLQLQQAQHTKQARHGGQPSGSQRDPETEQCDEDKLVRTIREGQETMLTLEQVQQLAPKALTRIWKEYVGQLAACLAKMESKPLAPVPRCLIRLTSEASMLLQRMAAGNPLATKTLIAGELEGEAIQPCMGPQEGPNRWPLVGRALNLSSQQASELMELRRRLLSNLSCILQQRREVIQHMRAVPTAHYTTGHFLEAQESLEQLQANLKQEHLLITEFVSAVHSRILSPTQLARCLVQSYPRAPDTLAIATWVASACGEADSGAMLVPPTSSCMPGGLSRLQESSAAQPSCLGIGGRSMHSMPSKPSTDSSTLGSMRLPESVLPQATSFCLPSSNASSLPSRHSMPSADETASREASNAASMASFPDTGSRPVITTSAAPSSSGPATTEHMGPDLPSLAGFSSIGFPASLPHIPPRNPTAHTFTSSLSGSWPDYPFPWSGTVAMDGLSPTAITTLADMMLPPVVSMPSCAALDNALGLQRAPGSASLPMFGSPFQDTPLRRHHSAASPGRPPQAVHIRMAPARAPPPGLHLTGSAPTAVYSGAALHSTSSPAPSGTTITTALPCWTRLQ